MLVPRVMLLIMRDPRASRRGRGRRRQRTLKLGTEQSLVRCGKRGSDEGPSTCARKLPLSNRHLQKLAEQAEIMADTTMDSNGKRALRFLAFRYARLAEFARARTQVSGPPVKDADSG
jgi:hypothetical protein